MGYLKSHHNSRLILDPTYPTIIRETFQHDHDWTEFYGTPHEPIPPDAPTPCGNPMVIRMFVDSDHASDKLTRQLRTRFLICINSALIDWLSKKQSTIEISAFGAKFVAMKMGLDRIHGLQYKLRMMGVDIDGPNYFYVDNMSVIHNTQQPDSILKKKSSSICYHPIRKSVAMGESLTTHILTLENPADLLTKVLYGVKRQTHVQNILYDSNDNC